jgi:hypothetical protein
LSFVIIVIKDEKKFIVSRIEASQDGSPYVYVGFTDPSSSSEERLQKQPQSPFGAKAFAFTSPEDLMKNLPKAMSNILGGGMGLSESPTFKLSMREYEDTGLRVGDAVTIQIEKAETSGI